MSNNLYITTTIPYVNAAPHIGFALELVQADVIARYQRLLGNTVRFQTGTDENALKNVLSARARGIPVEQLVEENAERFRLLGCRLNVSTDRFLRTTEPAHQRAVHALLARLDPGDLYTAAYKACYCADCEDFYLERELIEGNCPEHGKPVQQIEERNFFFRLSRYRDRLYALIATRELQVIPEQREREVLRFLEAGLTDISISRDAARAEGWGIRFPGDPSQVVYVWIDALVNYLTGLGFPDADAARFWHHDARKVHLVARTCGSSTRSIGPRFSCQRVCRYPTRSLPTAFSRVKGRRSAIEWRRDRTRAVHRRIWRRRDSILPATACSPVRRH
jgi:methionyl-tRNA synthetase